MHYGVSLCLRVFLQRRCTSACPSRSRYRALWSSTIRYGSVQYVLIKSVRSWTLQFLWHLGFTALLQYLNSFWNIIYSSSCGLTAICFGAKEKGAALIIREWHSSGRRRRKCTDCSLVISKSANFARALYALEQSIEASLSKHFCDVTLPICQAHSFSFPRFCWQTNIFCYSAQAVVRVAFSQLQSSTRFAHLFMMWDARGRCQQRSIRLHIVSMAMLLFFVCAKPSKLRYRHKILCVSPAFQCKSLLTKNKQQKTSFVPCHPSAWWRLPNS